MTKAGVTFTGCLLDLSLASSSLIFTPENGKGATMDLDRFPASLESEASGLVKLTTMDHAQ